MGCPKLTYLEDFDREYRTTRYSHLSIIQDTTQEKQNFHNPHTQSFFSKNLKVCPANFSKKNENLDGDYRYGFQGQEKDNEIKGKGNSLNYKYRMHDARLGRFFAIDPLTPQYPHYTPYSFSGNKVIAFRELEGLEEALAILPQPAIGGVIVPNGASEIRTFESEEVIGSVTGRSICVIGGSLKSFVYKGVKYSAHFDLETQVFQGYQDENQNGIILQHWMRAPNAPVDETDDIGAIQHSSSYAKETSPYLSWFRDLAVDVLNNVYVVGAVDDAIAISGDENSTASDIVNAWVPVLLSTRGGSSKKIKLRHYTSNKGLTDIKSSGTIRASDSDRVFTTRANKKPLGKVDAENKLGIKPGKGRNYIEFEVDASKVDTRINKDTGATEYSIKGDVKLDSKTTTYVKRN